jgi:hypothetical protein
MATINRDKMTQIVQSALTKSANSERWQKAIIRAASEIENNPYIHWNGHALIILSSSGELYESNGTCQCKAFVEYKQPCWHRAAARLFQLYYEAIH